MWKPAVAKPESLVKASAADDQRVPLPLTHRIAVIHRNPVVFGRQWAAIHIDQAPISIRPSRHYEDPLAVRLLHDLKSIRNLKLPRRSRWKTARHGIVFQKVPLPILVQVFGPGLEG